MNRASRTGRVSLPMPLWLQGVIEALFAVLLTLVLIAVPLAGMWWLGAFREMPLETLSALTGHIWLGTHGVPLDLNLTMGEGGTEPLTGTWCFIGWAGLLVPLLFGYRAGRRLLRASPSSSKLWLPLLGAVVSYALAALILTTMVSNDTVGVNLAAGTLIPTAWLIVAMLVGARSEAGSWEALLGADFTGWLERTSQVSRWTSSYLWSVVRAAVVGVLVAAAIASVMLSVQVVLQWASVAEVYQRLGSGIWGGASLTVLQLGMMPNAAWWTLSYLTGAGFSMGADSLVAPAGSSIGAQPGLPLLSAIPTDQSLASTWWLLLLPVAAGVVAGWWLLREGENHLEDWFRAKVPNTVAAMSLSTLVLGLLIGVLAAVVSFLPLILSGGSWGLGKFTEIGPQAWLAALLLGAQIGIGAMIGYLLAPLWEKYRYEGPDDEDDWLFDDEPTTR